MAAIFQNGGQKHKFVNISAANLCRILILVSKHTFIRARKVIELISNMYLQEKLLFWYLSPILRNKCGHWSTFFLPTQ